MKVCDVIGSSLENLPFPPTGVEILRYVTWQQDHGRYKHGSYSKKAIFISVTDNLISLYNENAPELVLMKSLSVYR